MYTDKELYDYAYASLVAIGQQDLASKVVVRFNRRMRSTAGRALLKECAVEINGLLPAFGKEEVQRTILHELAHLMAWETSRHNGHGGEWRLACAELGIPGESVTHTLPLPTTRQRKRWRYRCNHCQATLDRVRRIKRSTACGKCCKALNNGAFTSRFLLEEIQLV